MLPSCQLVPGKGDGRCFHLFGRKLGRLAGNWTRNASLLSHPLKFPGFICCKHCWAFYNISTQGRNFPPLGSETELLHVHHSRETEFCPILKVWCEGERPPLLPIFLKNFIIFLMLGYKSIEHIFTSTKELVMANQVHLVVFLMTLKLGQHLWQHGTSICPGSPL